jgi:hypothetical protein
MTAPRIQPRNSHTRDEKTVRLLAGQCPNSGDTAHASDCRIQAIDAFELHKYIAERTCGSSRKVPAKEPSIIEPVEIREFQAKKPFADKDDGLLVSSSRGDWTPSELFLSGVRALALQSSIIDVVRMFSGSSSATGGH